MIPNKTLIYGKYGIYSRTITANITIQDSAVYAIAIHVGSFCEEWKALIWMRINFVENFLGGIVNKIMKVTT